ncbi:MAG: tetratricopeptide repeat protein [Planctomycetes bacterium]|nr:tetratricopeptide repeat protein [Planctomycetota bacterium]
MLSPPKKEAVIRGEADRLLGRAAVTRGWVGEGRLAEAVAAQEREETEACRPRRLLGALLVERGDLTGAQLTALLDAQARAAIQEEDALFGAILVRNGLASWDAVGAALGAQLGMRVPKRIGEILQERGELSAQVFAATLRAQERMTGKRERGAARSEAEGSGCAAAPAPGPRSATSHDVAGGAAASPLDVTVGEAAWDADHPAAPGAATEIPTDVAPAPPPPPAPLLAGRYEILQKLGEGGMGAVYRVRDRRLGREIALKLLLCAERGLAEPDDLDRFQREVNAAAALHHPGIIRVLDVGETDGKPYYTMELLPGKDLAATLRTERVGPDMAAEITALVAEALAFAHAHYVLHRDIKPANVILHREPPPPGTLGPGQLTAKLLDFGLAKFAGREVQVPARAAADGSRHELTRPGALMGTPLYMSPEQFREATNVDSRADVYSLGAVLYEMLTGAPPFKDSPSLAALIGRVLDEDPAPPCRLARGLDPDLETICVKCLAKDRADRYATAAELAADCRRFLGGEPISARPTGPIGRLWKKAKRNRRVAVALAALTSTAVVGAVTASLVYDSYERQRRAGERRALEMTRADGLVKAGRVVDAIAAWSALLDEQEDLAEARLRRAQAFQSQGKRAEARADLDRVLAVDPRSVSALLERGGLRRLTGDLPGAVADLSLALAVVPGNATALIERAWALADAGEMERAEKDFVAAAACAQGPEERAQAWCGQGVVQLARDQREEARELLDRAINEDIECYRAYLERGRLRLAEARYPDAISDLTQAVKRDASGTEALLERARARHAALEEDGALEDCREAAARAPLDWHPHWDAARYASDPMRGAEAAGHTLDLNPGLAEAWLLRGWLRLAVAVPGAEPDFERARSLLPNPAPAFAGLALAALNRGDVDGALDLAEQAVATDPDYGGGHGCRAAALDKKGDVAGARAEYELCERLCRAVNVDGISYDRAAHVWRRTHSLPYVEIRTTDLEAQVLEIVLVGRRLVRARPHFGAVALLQAKALGMIASFERAEQLVSEALQRDPYLVEAWVLRSRIRLADPARRDQPGALADAEAAVRLAPSDPRAIECLGLARFCAEDHAGALEAFDRALAVAPELAVLHKRRADALRKLGRTAEAEAAVLRWRHTPPDAVAALEYLVPAHYSNYKRNFDVALALVNCALDEHPNAPVALMERGDIYNEQGLVDKSLLDNSHAMEIDVAHSVGLFAKAARYISKNKVPMPLIANMVISVANKNPDDAGAAGLSAMVRVLMKDYDGAIQEAGRALQLNPDFAVMYSLRGLCWVKKGEPARGKPDLQEGLKRAPDGGVPLYFMAQYAAITGDTKWALAFLGRSLDLGFGPYRDVIRRERAFESLAGNPQFEALIRER